LVIREAVVIRNGLNLGVHFTRALRGIHAKVDLTGANHAADKGARQAC